MLNSLPITVQRDSNGAFLVDAPLPVTPVRGTDDNEWCRGVWMIGDGLILKADTHPEAQWWTRQTKAEVKFLSRLAPEDAKYFPRVYATGTYKYRGHTLYWLLEEYVSCNTEARPVSAGVMNTVRRIANLYGLSDLDLDYNGGWCYCRNWAVRDNGVPVIWDFGAGKDHACSWEVAE